MKINKRLLVGTVAAAVLTGGYYASAQGLPSGLLGAPKITGVSYAPGTPAWLEYSGSPYRVGGPKGPTAGETWGQFQYHTQPTASTVNGAPSTVNQQASTSYSAATTPAVPGATMPYVLQSVQMDGYQVTAPVLPGSTVSVSGNSASGSHPHVTADWFDSRFGYYANGVASNAIAFSIRQGNLSLVANQETGSTLSSLVEQGWHLNAAGNTVTSPIYPNTPYPGSVGIKIVQLGPMGGFPVVSLWVMVEQPPGAPGLINEVMNHLSWQDTWN